ncbi:MAG TPA: hypothetical protein DCM08_07360 [Microscillaceae bacterium]|nr:hypothetical protein [Microscillaceae bacterium]
MPLTVLECLSTGTPVIISDIENLQALIQHNQNGLLFNSGNPDDLFSQIEKFEKHPQS